MEIPAALGSAEQNYWRLEPGQDTGANISTLARSGIWGDHKWQAWDVIKMQLLQQHRAQNSLLSFIMLQT